MNQVVPIRPVQLDYSNKQIDLIRRTVASDCDGKEFDLYLEVARRAGLDPFRKQIYAVVYNKSDPKKRKMSIITGIDGYRAIAARNRDYRPDEAAPVFETDLSAKSENNPAGIVSCMVKCWKQAPDGNWFAVAGIAYWDEFCPLSEVWEYSKEENKRVPTGCYALDKKSNWYRMPRVMIAKTAEAIALRKGWPEDLSGIYTEEEMDRSRVADVSASEAAEAYQQERRLVAIGGKDAVFVQWSPDSPLEAVPLGQFADRAVAFIQACTSLHDLDGWQGTNRVALQDFWARAKSDALGIKEALEARLTALAKAQNENTEGSAA